MVLASLPQSASEQKAAADEWPEQAGTQIPRGKGKHCDRCREGQECNASADVPPCRPSEYRGFAAVLLQDVFQHVGRLNGLRRKIEPTIAAQRPWRVEQATTRTALLHTYWLTCPTPLALQRKSLMASYPPVSR